MRIKLKVDGYEYDVPPPVGDILVEHGLALHDYLWKTTYDAVIKFGGGEGAEEGAFDGNMAASIADAAVVALDKAIAAEEARLSEAVKTGDGR